MKNRRFEWLLKTPIAHRGLHSGKKCPENTLCAFNQAIDRGFPIELDVHVIADNHIVVFHDDYLEHLTEKDGKIEEKTLSEIKDLQILDSDEKIPLLSEVLSLVDGKVPLLIEIKNTENKRGIEPVIKNILNRYRGNYAIQSYNPITLAWFRKNAPEIIRGQISSDFRQSDMNPAGKLILRLLLMSWYSQPDFIAYDIRCIPVWAVTFLRKWKPVLLWTARVDAEIAKAKSCADNYIFEIPANVTVK